MAEQADFEFGRLLVVAFEGWNDAGEAASGAVRMLREQLDLEQLAAVDPEDYFDYQFNRPLIAVDDDGNRTLTWPTVALFGPTKPLEVPLELADDALLGVTGDNGSNIYLLVGNEPSRGWKTFTAEILDAIVDSGITTIVFLGAMLADVPHTRPISVFVSSENASVREHLSIERSSYEGPVGIL